MVPDLPATAEGELERTPFVHLAVYALERRLTGALFLVDPKGDVHTVRFARGVPVKIRPGDGYALLGELLVEGGFITRVTLSRALEAKGRLGDVLVLSDKVEPKVVEETVHKQFRMRMTHLFELPPATTYKYFDGHHELVDWGGEPPLVDPYELIWAGIEAHGGDSTMMEGTLDKLGETPIELHPKHAVQRFNMAGDAKQVLDLIALDPTSLPDLLALEVVPPETVRRVVYALMVLRQINLGPKSVPVDTDVSSSPGVVGKVRLVTRALRVQAAAPDAPGDGERAPVVPRSRSKKSLGAMKATDEPPSSGPEVLPGEAVPTPAPLDDEPTPLSVTETRRIPSEVAAAAAGATAPQAATPAGSSEAPTAEAPVGDTPSEARSGIQEVGRRASPLPKGLDAAGLFELGRTRFFNREFDGAVEALEASRELDPKQRDTIALLAFARSHVAGADLKAIALELDELIRGDEAWVEPRFYRGATRKKLGDDAGARRDFERVLELSPDHAGARAQLGLGQPTKSSPQEIGLFGRLFRR